jgi:hypothetical protein
VKVYAGIDPLTGREIRLRRTCKTERAAQIELGKLLEQAVAGRQPDSAVTVAQLLDQYVSTARWDVSTRESNLGYIRRTIKPAIGSTQVRKVRGPLLDTLYARLMRCGNLTCTGKPFTEHHNIPDLRPDPPDPRLDWQQAAARAAAKRAGLNAAQRDAVVMMLTAAAATTVLIAPAGAGKSHTMAEFAPLWTTFTGQRVIGLTTSTNAARVLQHEGLAESYNIAGFLGKVEGSDELRRAVPLHQNDVLVLDEASQLSTTDLAMIGDAARQAGARVVATSDTAQLGAVEAGGMFWLLA